jgi:hypothetical protein
MKHGDFVVKPDAAFDIRGKEFRTGLAPKPWELSKYSQVPDKRTPD